MASEKPHSIELRLREVSQLFNSMDPAPFHEKDLDHDAEEFIVSWAQEYPLKEPLTLKIYLEEWPREDPVEMIQKAVHHYFAYRTEISRRDFKHLTKQAQTSLLIGLAFLATCLFGANMIRTYNSDQIWAAILEESLTIAGWVAMWRPIQLYLYDWWPVYQQIGLYKKLSQVPAEVIRSPKAV